MLPWVVALIGVLCYVNTMPNELVFDSVPSITPSRLNVQSWQDFEPLVVGNRRPVVNASLALNYAIGGMDTAGFHLFNLVIHVLAGMTLYGILHRTLTLYKPGTHWARSAPWLAAAAALLWVSHPLNTQAVSYVIQRAESMAGLFYLLMFYCLLRYVEPQKQQIALIPGQTQAKKQDHKYLWAVGVVAAYLMGLGTKEVIVTAPIVLFLFDRTFVTGAFRKTLNLRWKLYAALASPYLLVLAMLATGSFTDEASAGFGITAISPLGYLLSQGEVILHYLRLAVWPWPLVLDYRWPSSYLLGGWVLPTVIVAAMVLAVAVGVYLRNWWGFMGAWFFLILAPTSSILPLGDLAMEHRMYLSLIAIVVSAVMLGYWGLRTLLGEKLLITVGGVLIMLITGVLASVTIMRNFEYRTALSMWQTVVERAPYNPRGYQGLGDELQKQGKFSEAFPIYQQALAIDPHEPNVLNNFGAMLLSMNQPKRAAERFIQARDTAPNDPQVHYNLGRALAMLNDDAAAEASFLQAIALQPRYAQAHNNLGILYAKQGRTQQAEAQFRKAIELAPSLPEPQQSLGTLMMETGRPRSAAEHFQRAIRLGKVDAVLYTSLASAYVQTGEVVNAIGQLNLAIAINENYVPAHLLLGMASQELGDSLTAMQAYRGALRLDPSLLDAAIPYAMLVTSHPSEWARDAEVALHVLQPFIGKVTGRPDFDEALASTYAELGHFDKAIAAQTHAIETAKAAGATEDQLKPMQQRLADYQAGKPYRDPRWRDDMEWDRDGVIVPFY